MDQKNEEKKESKAKGFFGRLFDKVDKKLEEKAKKNSCSCCGDKPEKKSCCG